MLIWIILLVFAVPLFAYLQASRQANKNRERRLNAIQNRLREKQEQALADKLDRIKNKNIPKR